MYNNVFQCLITIFSKGRFGDIGLTAAAIRRCKVDFLQPSKKEQKPGIPGLSNIKITKKMQILMYLCRK